MKLSTDRSLRDTDYATEIKTVAIGDNRIERIFVKDENQEEIRLSWWPGGHMANRPLDVPEHQLIGLLAKGIQDGVLSSRFLSQLIIATGQI